MHAPPHHWNSEGQMNFGQNFQYALDLLDLAKDIAHSYSQYDSVKDIPANVIEDWQQRARALVKKMDPRC